MSYHRPEHHPTWSTDEVERLLCPITPAHAAALEDLDWLPGPTRSWTPEQVAARVRNTVAQRRRRMAHGTGYTPSY